MLQDKDIFTIFAAGLEGTASPLNEWILKCRKPATLQGLTLATY